MAFESKNSLESMSQAFIPYSSDIFDKSSSLLNPTDYSSLSLFTSQTQSIESPCDIVSCRACHQSFRDIGCLTIHKCLTKNVSFNQRNIEYNAVSLMSGLKAQNSFCKWCHAPFALKVDLEQHIRSVHNIATKSHICSFCTKSFYKKKSLFSHQRLSHPNLIYDICDMQEPFEQIESFCEICDSDFLDDSQFKQHIQLHQGNFLNSTTDFEKSNNNLLTPHEMSIKDHGKEERQHKCSFCDATFSQSHQLVLHQDVHKEQFLKHCSICSKTFRTHRSYLEHVESIGHIKLSAEKEGRKIVIEKHLGCSLCKARFHLVKSLHKHLKEFHDQSISHKCSLCESSFRNKTNLKRHMASHEDRKDFKCKKCNATFRSQNNLKDHNSYVHSEKREHSCNVCDKKFKGSSNLKRHLKLHSIPHPFTCKCGQGFKSCSQLEKHKMSQHQKEDLKMSSKENSLDASNEEIPSIQNATTAYPTSQELAIKEDSLDFFKLDEDIFAYLEDSLDFDYGNLSTPFLMDETSPDFTELPADFSLNNMDNLRLAGNSFPSDVPEIDLNASLQPLGANIYYRDIYPTFSEKSYPAEHILSNAKSTGALPSLFPRDPLFSYNNTHHSSN